MHVKSVFNSKSKVCMLELLGRANISSLTMAIQIQRVQYFYPEEH